MLTARNMNSSCSRSHFLVLLLGVSIGSSSDLLAQRTWIVDAAGGAGSNFNDLPAAVAVAAPGDRIEIVPFASLYSGARVTKGISILAGGAGVSLGSPLYLSGIPLGGTCVVSGIAFADTWLQVEQCKGAVVLFGLGPSRTWFSMNVLSSDAVCMD